MNYNHILLSTSFLIFSSYVAYIWISKGIQKSISESYYKIKRKEIFTLVMWGFAIPAMIVGSTPLMFFAGAGVCFIGTAPAFKRDDMEMKVHVVGAVSGVVLSMVSMWLDFGIWEIPVLAGPVFLLLFLKVKNYTWWIEILSFYLVMLGLLIKT